MMHQEDPGLCHYCSSSGLAGVWESGLFPHASHFKRKQYSTDSIFLYLIRIMRLLDSPAEDVLLIRVLQEIVSVHSLKIASLTSHCGFGDLFPGAGSQMFQNTHGIVGFHPRLSLLTDCQLDPQSQSLLRPQVTPPCRHLGMGRSSAPLSAGEAGDTPDRMPSLP